MEDKSSWLAWTSTTSLHHAVSQRSCKCPRHRLISTLSSSSDGPPWSSLNAFLLPSVCFYGPFPSSSSLFLFPLPTKGFCFCFCFCLLRQNLDLHHQYHLRITIIITTHPPLFSLLSRPFPLAPLSYRFMLCRDPPLYRPPLDYPPPIFHRHCFSRREILAEETLLQPSVA